MERFVPLYLCTFKVASVIFVKVKYADLSSQTVSSLSHEVTLKKQSL